jgi:hypothetical protein
LKNNYKDKIKVLTTLSLASTDAREDTLASVIISTLNDLERVERTNLNFYIEENFGFQPYKEEVDLLLKKLEKESKIIFIKGELSITDEQKQEIKAAEIILRDKDKARFNNFKNFIIDQGFNDLENTEIKQLWNTFIEYLYNNFYDYGEDALKRLHPNLSYNKDFDKEEDYLKIAFQSLKIKKLNKPFKLSVEKFADYASQDDIEFLNDLAQKTLSFTSLGIDPKLSETALDISLVDWVLYLDTNVLYSILNLHFHPENDATKALIALINENKQHLSVVLRYSELTKKELRAKTDEFNLLDEKLTDSSIKAAISSEKLDGFSKQYYQNLLTDRDSTLHPSKIVEISSSILLNSEIDVARNSKRVEHLGEEYLNEKIQEYRRYIDQKNDHKEDFLKSKGINFHPIFKSDKQITHDITLRELIIDQRFALKKKKELKELDFNSIKFFGLTLDSLLINYDSYQMRRFEDERSFPIFFKPSYLLNRLVRILPIQTKDYKKAFIKAVTSKGFNKDAKKSRDILKIINYLKLQGIDDEKVIYNLISKDLFIEKYSKIDSQNNKEIEEFFESELNKQLKKRQKELESTKEKLEQKDHEALEATEKSKNLETKKTVLQSDLEIYKKALKKLSSDVRRLEKDVDASPSQVTMNFEAEESKKKLEDSTQLLTVAQKALLLEYSIQAKTFKDSELRKWQNKTWWNLLWVIPLTILALSVVLFPDWYFDPESDSTTIKVILGFFLILIDGIFINLIKLRFWDENNKSKKKENIELPATLQSKINSIKH